MITPEPIATTTIDLANRTGDRSLNFRIPSFNGIDLATGPDKTVLVDQHDTTFETGSQVAPKRVPRDMSMQILKKAFRRFKMSRKKGAGLIVTRYTRHGKPVY